MMTAVIAGGRRVVFVPPAFNPATLFSAGQQGVWYDPSDFTSMFQDVAGTVPVTAVGQAVARINDKSGRGYHATQATAPSRPILRQDANGKYYLEFDGLDDSLSTLAINFTATNKATLCGGYNVIGTGTGIFAEISASVSSSDGSFLQAFSAANAGNDYFLLRGTVAGNDSFTGVKALPRKNVSFVQFDTSAATSALQIIARFNQVQATLLLGGATSAGNFGTHQLFIGARNANQLFFNGSMYSLIVRGAASTATEITDTETYVNSKTGAF